MLRIPDLLLAITALTNAGLVTLIYRKRNKDWTDLYFAGFVASLCLWAITLIFYLSFSNPILALYGLKLSYVSALLIGISFYFFSVSFPDNKPVPRSHALVILGVSSVFSAAILAFPDFMTHGIAERSAERISRLGYPEYLTFSALFSLLFGGGLVRIWTKYVSAAVKAHKLQLLAIGASVTTAGMIGIYFNLVLPSPFFEDFRYIWTGPLFTFIIALTITYSIFKLKLFNVKAFAAEVFTFSLWLLILIRTLLSTTPTDQVINGALFVATLISGMFLVRSVLHEVEQREEIEAVSKQQENLLHFISHEIKGYLAKNEAAFAAIVEGDYGPVSADLSEMAKSALADVRKGTATVMDMLDAANMKRGTVAYNMAPFDFKEAVLSVADDQRKAAEEKGLFFEVIFAPSGNYLVNGDEAKLSHHVIRNLIDNAVRYTLEGKITVGISRKGNVVSFSVEDTGVGITEEDKARLFTEGGHGKDSIKVNVHSTGYGLFIAKQVVEAHRGTIAATSAGAGQGTRFVVELPAAA